MHEWYLLYTNTKPDISETQTQQPCLKMLQSSQKKTPVILIASLHLRQMSDPRSCWRRSTSQERNMWYENRTRSHRRRENTWVMCVSGAYLPLPKMRIIQRKRDHPKQLNLLNIWNQTIHQQHLHSARFVLQCATMFWICWKKTMGHACLTRHLLSPPLENPADLLASLWNKRVRHSCPFRWASLYIYCTRP